jgi:hypothetical protein
MKPVNGKRLTIGQAAALIGISENLMRKEINAGHVTVLRRNGRPTGRVLGVYEAHALEWMEKQLVSAAEGSGSPKHQAVDDAIAKLPGANKCL